MRNRLPAIVLALTTSWTAQHLFADDFDDLIRQVNQIQTFSPAEGWVSSTLAHNVTDEAIAHRKQMVIHAAAEDRLLVKAKTPQYLFPVMIAKLMVNPNDQEALAYFLKNMQSRSQGDMFGQSSLSRMLCQFEQKLDSGTIDAIRKEAIEFRSFLGGGTENHVAMRRTAGYLFGEHFPKATFEYGLSGEALAQQCREFMRTYGKTIYASSMFEYLSPIYHAVNTGPWLNVVDFAKDDSAKLMARAIVDWMMVDYALNYHQGMLLAPLTREKGLITDSYQLSYARCISQWTGWLYWGGGNTPQSGNSFPDQKYLHHQSLGAVLHSASPYTPHPVIRNIGAKRLPGPYMALQSRLNWRAIEQTHVNKYGKPRVGPSQPDPRYNLRSFYVDHDYAIGAGNRHEDIMDPYLDSVVPFNVVWKSKDDCNWLMPAHPFWYTLRKWEGSDEVLGNEDWSGASPFQQMVHWENAAVLVWDIPKHDPYEGRYGKGSPLFESQRTLDLIQCVYIYVPETIDEKRESPAGFFLREGDVYVALRPLQKGAAWQPSHHHDFIRLAMPGALVGVAIEVGDKHEFGSFDAFQAKTTATPLDLSAFQTEKRAVYRSTRGHVLSIRHKSPNWLPDASVNGVPLDFDRWPTCESPYVTCRNRVLDVNDGKQGFTIDWRGDLPEYTYYDVLGTNKKITGREGIKDGKLQSRPAE